MRHSDTRILTTHVGSLDAISRSAAARRRHTRQSPTIGRATPPRSRAPRSTSSPVRQDAGLDIVNDGEYGKSSWANYVLDRMTGFELRPDTLLRGGVARPRSRAVQRVHEGRVSARRRSARPATPASVRFDTRPREHPPQHRAICKTALESAGVEEGFLPPSRRRVPATTPSTSIYQDEREYVFAIAEALREEYLEIVNAGLVLQVDDAVLANMYDELVQQSPSDIGSGRSCGSRR